MQAWAKISSPSDINISPTNNPLVTLGLTCDNDDDDRVSLFGRAYLDREPAGDDVYILGNNLSLTGGDVYPLGGESLVASTTT